METIGCRCPLLTKSPHAFQHDGLPCGWPDLASVCPDCGKEGELCTFFSEIVEEGACAGLTRLVALCIRCQLDGAKQRREPQLRQRIVVLSGGEGSQRAVSFATGHVKTYKDGVKLVDGIWLPQDLSTPDKEFFWDRNVVPWRFLLEPTTGAEPVTMRGLLGVLGIMTTEDSLPSSQPALDVAALAAQVRQLSQMVQALTQSSPNGGGRSFGIADEVEAARAAEALGQAQAGNSQVPSGGSSWNPSQTFNLGGQVGSGTVINNSSNDLDLAQLLASQGASAEQIMRFLQSRGPRGGLAEHRTAWLQVMEGTSPLCVYTGMRGETRKAATAKQLNVQTQDGAGKLTMKLSIWPPARPEDVAVYTIRELGDDWKRGLAQGNLRLVQITPTADRAAVPEIPLNVDRFLEHCYSCLRAYEHVSVLRAWEAAHHFMVDEYIAKRSQPTWDSIWMMPVFQVELRKMARSAEGTFDVKRCCVNWNMRSGQRCVKDPDAACTKLHICMKCGGDHRILECSRE